MDKALAWINRIWLVIERWLTRERIRFLSWGILGVTLILAVLAFALANENHRIGSWSLGADFAGFYYAGKILNGPTPERLYDEATQDEAYYEIFPTLRPTDEEHPGRHLPYIHPPIVAFVFRPLARLSYATAFAIWLVISGALYITGLAITCRLLPSMPSADRNLAMLLALTFEPFLMEAWLGGQLSAFAFLCLALAFYWEEAGRPILSGLALGLCLYKPTLVLLVLPMLLVARRFWTLLGVCLTGVTLILVSLLAVGQEICLSYIDALQGFTGTATGTGMERKDWKFIDLNFFFRSLFGEPTTAGNVLVVTLAAAPLILLVISWWGMDRGETFRRLVWSSTVTWTMVINVYMGIYDMILVVLAVLWTADVFYRQGNPLAAFFSTFKLLVLLVAVSAWLHPSAALTHFQIVTPVLFALAAFQLRLAWKATPIEGRTRMA